MPSKIINSVGDVDPITHGGGYILKHPSGHYILTYTDGTEAWAHVNKETGKKTIEVYEMHLPRTWKELKSDLNWVDFKKVNDSIGMSMSEWKEFIKEVRNATGDKAAVLYARLFENIAGYYGWHELDNYPQEMLPRDAKRAIRGTLHKAF